MYRYELGLNKYPSVALLKRGGNLAQFPLRLVCVSGQPRPFLCLVSVSVVCSLDSLARPSFRHLSSPASRRCMSTAVGITTHVHRPSSPPRTSSLRERRPGLPCLRTPELTRGHPCRVTMPLMRSGNGVSIDRDKYVKGREV